MDFEIEIRSSYYGVSVNSRGTLEIQFLAIFYCRF